MIINIHDLEFLPNNLEYVKAVTKWKDVKLNGDYIATIKSDENSDRISDTFITCQKLLTMRACDVIYLQNIHYIPNSILENLNKELKKVRNV